MASSFRTPGGVVRNLERDASADTHKPFRAYYSLDRSDELDEADGKPFGRELKGGYYEPPHSPFGLIGQIARDTGWSIRQILDTPYITIMLMMADTPEYIDEKKAQKRYMQRLMGGERTQKGVDPLTFFTTMARKD